MISLVLYRRPCLPTHSVGRSVAPSTHLSKPSVPFKKSLNIPPTTLHYNYPGGWADETSFLYIHLLYTHTIQFPPRVFCILETGTKRKRQGLDAKHDMHTLKQLKRPWIHTKSIDPRAKKEEKKDRKSKERRQRRRGLRPHRTPTPPTASPSSGPSPAPPLPPPPRSCACAPSPSPAPPPAPAPGSALPSPSSPSWAPAPASRRTARPRR